MHADDTSYQRHPLLFILGTKLRKATFSFVTSGCPSVRSHGTSRPSCLSCLCVCYVRMQIHDTVPKKSNRRVAQSVKQVGYGMDGPGLEFRYRQEFSPFSTTSKPALGLSNAYQSSLPGIKRPGHEVYHSPPFNADVKNEWTHTSTPTICIHDMDKDDFYHNKKKSSNREKLKPFLPSFLFSFSLSLSFLPYLPFFPCLRSLLRLFPFSPYFLSFFLLRSSYFFRSLSSCKWFIHISYNLANIRYSYPTVHRLTTKSLPTYQHRGFVIIHTRALSFTSCSIRGFSLRRCEFNLEIMVQNCNNSSPSTPKFSQTNYHSNNTLYFFTYRLRDRKRAHQTPKYHGHRRIPKICIYRVSQEECEILRESVPYVKLHRYNPKHIYPKLNGYGDNGQRILKL